MKIACNIENVESMLKIINGQPDTYLEASFRMPNDANDLEAIIKSEFWPEAIENQTIVRSEEAIKRRAKSIIGSFARACGSTKLLDYGCGNGSCVDAANSLPSRINHVNASSPITVGYDINRHADWEKSSSLITDDFGTVMDYGPYDMILLYDVIDHIEENKINDVITLLRSVSNKGAYWKVRCHPWTSIHGGHLYENLNRAYAHLFMTEDQLSKFKTEFVRKIYNPIETYNRLWNQHELTVVESNIHKTNINDIEAFFSETDILKHLNQNIDIKKTIKDSILQIEFVDYTLRADSDIKLFI
jgi:hypothetical protein